jgi:hypothetical protein
MPRRTSDWVRGGLGHAKRRGRAGSSRPQSTLVLRFCSTASSMVVDDSTTVEIELAVTTAFEIAMAVDGLQDNQNCKLYGQARWTIYTPGVVVIVLITRGTLRWLEHNAADAEREGRAAYTLPADVRYLARLSGLHVGAGFLKGEAAADADSTRSPTA